jgi:hypothetical protein
MRGSQPRTYLQLAALFFVVAALTLSTQHWYYTTFTFFIGLIYVERWAFSSVIQSKNEVILSKNKEIERLQASLPAKADERQ